MARPVKPRIGKRRNLPSTFPGCWQDREWRRAYNRMHERIRAGRPNDAGPSKPYQRYCTAAERRAAKRRTQSAYWRRVRRGQGRLRAMRLDGPTCFNCWRAARTRIERMVPLDESGRAPLLRVRVPYCGRC